MTSFQIFFTIAVFCFTIMFIIWRPRGINEAVPAGIGAGLLIIAGIVPLGDTLYILDTVKGAVITILSTIMMSLVLDSIGFFRWTAFNMIRWAKGSGTLLFFFYICLLCFLMTLFFNNDGSILITTPIIIQILSFLNLKTKECLPYLFAGALIATASSAPIAVSNLANLIALKIVGLEINDYVLLMFVPTLVGIIVLGTLVYFYFKPDIPRKIPASPHSFNTWLEHNTSLNYKQGHRAIRQHPLMETVQEHQPMDFPLFRLCISIVILTRAGLFLGSSSGIPMEMIALAGAVLLIGVRWKWMRIGWQDVIKKCPWHILIFAFSIYVVIHALHLIGLTTLLVNLVQPFIAESHIHAIMITGGFATLIANLFNNIPAVMIGTITLTEMGLDFELMQLAYLANIIGSDLGALISPMGTLATLLWMFILKNHRIPISWGKYFKVVIAVVPISTVVTLFSLYFWTRLFF